MSIYEIYNGEKATYEVPIYQRNYAWEKDEIYALIQDVYDAYTSKNKNYYYIGTLVSFNKGDQVYEVIDGQQRLTTIYLVLRALEINIQNKLSYRARKRSDETIKSIPNFEINEKDNGIFNGFQYAESAIKDIVSKEELENFEKYFQNSVHIIHYQVPKDIDLNHYFEIMNSRGEQLEKHEIIKARLIEKLGNDEDKQKFNLLWESCSDMNVYIQQKYYQATAAIDKPTTTTNIFGESLSSFKISGFDKLPPVEFDAGKKTIDVFLNDNSSKNNKIIEDNKIDLFQSIIDFPNFLLIVLKLTLIERDEFNPIDFTLDDKELIRIFYKIELNECFVKEFGFNLLKAKFLLDNYMVHHANEDDTIGRNPWKLQVWNKDNNNSYPKNLDGNTDEQHKLVQLLSMFEVSFTPRQRKNYLFYCLLHLFRDDKLDIRNYFKFVSSLADKYFKDVYLNQDMLSENNTPKSGSFDSTIIPKNQLNTTPLRTNIDFNKIYGNGSSESKGIPLFIFNYLDYKLWNKYYDKLRNRTTQINDKLRKEFFDELGCSDFGLEVFDQFYFSRTRRSLEHYYPQANASGEDKPTQAQINCLGNYAMIGSEINSSGSNWSPKIKLDHYLDSTSGKVKLVSVASLKFMIMMQKCKDNSSDREVGKEWIFDDIKEHQDKMLTVMTS